MQVSLFQKIPKPIFGKRWVITDIHGCPNTLRALVETKISLTKADQLFLLGDYIDRGPDSGAVIDYILELQTQSFKVFPLRGNHEEMLLESVQEGNERYTKMLLRINKNFGMLDASGKVATRYIEFIKHLPYFFELDNFFLVHASFDFRGESPLEDTKAMLWKRGAEHNAKYLGNKRIVHGHVPTPIELVRESIEKKAMVLPLDTGCAYLKPRNTRAIDVSKLGVLSALNLDDFSLLVQKNIDMII